MNNNNHPSPQDMDATFERLRRISFEELMRLDDLAFRNGTRQSTRSIVDATPGWTWKEFVAEKYRRSAMSDKQGARW